MAEPRRKIAYLPQENHLINRFIIMGEVMINESGEWSAKELKQLFDFAPEDSIASDTDILYSGECIDVENGGIKEYCSQELMNELTEQNILERPKKKKKIEDYNYLLPQNSFVTPVYSTVNDKNKTKEIFNDFNAFDE